MVTDLEKKIIHDLGECWNKFVSLDVEHGADRDEFMRAIHAAQNIVAARSAYRYIKDNP